MTSELSTALIEEITKTFEESVILDEKILEMLLLKCNKTRKLGLLLIELHDQCKWGEWGSICKRTFPFSRVSAQKFMSLAKAHPEEFTSLEDGIRTLHDVYIAYGVIQPPLGHATQSRSSLSWIDRFGGAIMRAFGYFNGQIEKLETTVETLPPNDKQILKERLQPLVDIHAKL